MGIIDDMQELQALENSIVDKYADLLTRTFQVIYEVKAEVAWERIYQLSSESNFLMVTGTTMLLKGTVLGESTEVDEDRSLDVSFTIPLSSLDDGSTPYEIADAAATIARARKIMEAEEFFELIRSSDTNMDLLDTMLPPLTPDLSEKTNTVANLERVPGVKKQHPQLLSSFDTDALTDEQKASFLLHTGYK